MPISIRIATEKDAESIAEIYNAAILKTTATFDTEVKSTQDRQAWIQSHDARHPVTVACSEDGQVLGFGSLSKWSDRCAYADTCENSIYVSETARGQGIGLILLQDLLDRAHAFKFHTVIARITSESTASLRLHEKLGFVKVGTLCEVGNKFNRLHDVHLYQLIFSKV